MFAVRVEIIPAASATLIPLEGVRKSHWDLCDWSKSSSKWYFRDWIAIGLISQRRKERFWTCDVIFPHPAGLSSARSNSRGFLLSPRSRNEAIKILNGYNKLSSFRFPVCYQHRNVLTPVRTCVCAHVCVRACVRVCMGTKNIVLTVESLSSLVHNTLGNTCTEKDSDSRAEAESFRN